MNINQTLSAIAKKREAGEKIVFTNGCFDILHIGHVRYLAQARELGDKLIVGLNSDRSVSAIKGPKRPLNSEANRAEMLLALSAVDYVCLFDEETPLELIKQVQPAILVKGGDWPIESIVGADFVQSKGGQVLSLPFVEGASTTGTIEQIVEAYGNKTEG